MKIAVEAPEIEVARKMVSCIIHGWTSCCAVSTASRLPCSLSFGSASTGRSGSHWAAISICTSRWLVRSSFVSRVVNYLSLGSLTTL